MNLNNFISKNFLIEYNLPENLENIEKFEGNWEIVIPDSYKNWLQSSSSTLFNSNSKTLSENVNIGERIKLYSIKMIEYNLKERRPFRQEAKIIFESEDNMLQIGKTDYGQSIFIGIKGSEEGKIFMFEDMNDSDIIENEDGFFLFPSFKISNTFEDFLELIFAISEPY
ncbi:SMI1/KNR4 family protein [Emticicia agri]|uniref:Knr4/Smi1-like domain-containing protein n=1 Tax=Emticicia agri TaxID=2492393 RepID=A0A4Q5LYX2_9BACT|nr:SMI1/KNR4 family protein [Emticicia agri]RYU94733.1 hypothetical protein EWM59_15485 [Emticicia agri]